MITVEHFKSRFFDGDNITYHDASTAWLLEKAKQEDDALRIFAAAGLMRALLDTRLELRESQTFFQSMEWARDVILDIQAGKPPRDAGSKVQEFVEVLPAVNGFFDGTSIVATKANNPRITAAIIDKYIPKDEAKLVIGLGHSGVLSSLATYSALAGDNAFYAVRFSRHKAEDDSPVLADNEVNALKDLSSGRAVVIHDEDRAFCGGGTIRGAVSYINHILGVPAYGITPVLARHPTSMWPEVVKKSSDRLGFMTDEYEPWSDEFRAIVGELEGSEA